MSTPQRDAIRIAQQKIEAKPVYLDTETTGIDKHAEVIEISILDHDGSVLVDTLVRAQNPIPWEATRVHHITDAHLNNAPTWPEVWPQIEQAMRGRVVGIYNADFDVRLMHQTCTRYDISWNFPETEFLCIMKLYAQYIAQPGRYPGAYRWWKLEQAGKKCGLPMPNSHRAKADTRLTRAVLQYMAAQTATPGW